MAKRSQSTRARTAPGAARKARAAPPPGTTATAKPSPKSRKTPRSKSRSKPKSKRAPRVTLEVAAEFKPAAEPRVRRRRTVSAEERRRAILDAALAVFAARGFAAAKLDDVAAAAGVAKGTLYLYFPNKESLFEELIRSAAKPMLNELQAVAGKDLPLAALLERMFDLFRREVLGSERKLVIRLLLTEGPRFPEIARFHHREVLSKVLPVLAQVARRAAARGELSTDAMVRFPQLIMAPLILAIVWDALFGSFAPLDVKGLLAAHMDAILAKKGAGR